jgi:hypothetical protein
VLFVGEQGLEIGGLRTSVVTRDPKLARLVTKRYKGFLSEGVPDWQIEIGVKLDRPSSLPEEVSVRPNGVSGRFTIERGDFFGSVDLRERSGRVALIESDEISLDSFFRIAFSLALVDVRGVLVHAASLARKGKAYLFCGLSASGKSTIAHVSRDATILTDELSITRLHPQGAICYGTPFWRKLARGGENLSAPLVGIYFLHRGNGHKIDALKAKQALERLLPNIIFFAKEPRMTARLLAVATALVESVPCFDLTFLPDPDLWEVIEHA